MVPAAATSGARRPRSDHPERPRAHDRHPGVREAGEGSVGRGPAKDLREAPRDQAAHGAVLRGDHRDPGGAGEVTWLDRFWDRAEPEPNTGCWLWTGSINSYGYGYISCSPNGERLRVNTAAHRIAFELATRTQIPKHLQIDHRCRVRCCINPQHLELVTVRE